MWQSVARSLKLLFNFGEKLERHDADIETLQQEVRALTTAVQRLAYELQRSEDRAAHEREKMALQWEIKSLRSAATPPGREPREEGSAPSDDMPST